MEIRGERECQDCGTRWSYFEIGEIACPSCGSVRSVGVGDLTRHTGGQPELDLAAARSAVDEEPVQSVGGVAADSAREYVRATGFVVAGELQPLSDEYLLAREIEMVGTTLARAMRVSDDEEHYLLTLLRASLDGDRPGPDAVAKTLQPERGLAVSRAIGDYHRDLRAFLDEMDSTLASALSAIRARRKRIDALDGDVDPRRAERLVGATRDVYAYLERDDETALARVTERLRD